MKNILWAQYSNEHPNVLTDSHKSKFFLDFLLLFISLLIPFSKRLNISLQHRHFYIKNTFNLVSVVSTQMFKLFFLGYCFKSKMICENRRLNAHCFLDKLNTFLYSNPGITKEEQTVLLVSLLPAGATEVCMLEL